MARLTAITENEGKCLCVHILNDICQLSQWWGYWPLATPPLLFCITEGLTPTFFISQAPRSTDSANGRHLWEFNVWERGRSWNILPFPLWAVALPLTKSPLCGSFFCQVSLAAGLWGFPSSRTLQPPYCKGFLLSLNSRLPHCLLFAFSAFPSPV